MIIVCPHCEHSRDVGDVRIPDNGVTAICPVCRAQIFLQPNLPSIPLPITNCPSCAFAPSSGKMPETCPHCGVVVEKFLKRQKAEPAITPPSPLHEASVSPRKRYKYLLIGLLAAVIASVLYKFAPDLKLDEHYVLTRSIWQGDMSYLGKKHPFVLVIESVENGQLEGYMDWVGFSPRYRLAIRGSYKGNHLLFVDYKFLEGSGAYGLNDKKDVYIIENEMLGTDKNGNATLRAVKRESIPM